MSVEEIRKQIELYHSTGKKMFMTSSFQTHSIPLLHMISRLQAKIDVLFINTGFHFPETIVFRNEVVELLGLNMIDVQPSTTKIQQRDATGHFYFASDPDYCCYLNKTQPLEKYLMEYDVWINGVRADQSKTRKQMNAEEATPFKAVRFHPLLNWSLKDVYRYKKEHQLPTHPLDAKGYQSIGCVPCTRKFDFNDERSARWYGMNKTECGLHTDLIKK